MGITTEAGLLKDGKITPEALAPILRGHAKIQEVGGEKGLLFPCGGGSQIKPVPPELRLPDDIANKEKYPEYHTEVIGRYESILKALDIDGNFSLPPPFIDPVALGVALNGKPPDFNFSIGAMLSLANPFAMADALNVDGFELAKKLIPGVEGSLIKVPAPNFSLPPYGTPEYFANLKNISLPIPASNFSIAYPDKIEAELWKSPQLGVVMVLMKVVQKIIQEPTLVLDLLSVPPKPCFIIDAVQESKIFGSSDSGEVGKSSTDQHLITWTGSLLGGVTIGLLPGNGGKNGAVGNYFRAVEIIDQEAPAEILGGQRLPAKRTPLTKEEAATALFSADPKLLDTPQRLAVLLAHWNLETGGGKYTWNYNFGNVKASTGWSGDYSYFATNEVFYKNNNESMNLFSAYLREGGIKLREPQRPEDDPMAWSFYDPNFQPKQEVNLRNPYKGRYRDKHVHQVTNTTSTNDEKSGKNILWFYPDHHGCKWRAFRTAEDGAKYWVDFMKGKAQQQILSGDINQYAKQLITIRYFTADKDEYTKSLKSSYQQMLPIAIKVINQNKA